MPTDRPRRRFEDDDDRDQPDDQRLGGLPVGLVLLSCGAAVLLLLVVAAAAFQFTARQQPRPPEAIQLDEATDARLAADVARVKAEQAAAPRVLDQAAWDEVRGAFSDNKVAARETYKDVRWVLQVRIGQIGNAAVAATHPVIDRRFELRFRSPDDVKGLKPDQDREVTGRLAPLDLTSDQIVFEDVRLR